MRTYRYSGRLVLRKGERHKKKRKRNRTFVDQNCQIIFLCQNDEISYFSLINTTIQLRSNTIMKNVNDLWKNNSLEFTVLRHKINVLAPFYSVP